MTSGIEDVMALSPLQQGLYSMTVLSGADAHSDPYVIAMAADVTGTLDITLLRKCAAAMLARHPNLRAGFFRGDLPRPVQVVPTAVDVPWEQHAVQTDDEAAHIEDEARRRPFDLERGPVLRFVLIEKPGRQWRLVIVAHHIVIDGWSLPLFVGELVTLYRAGGDASALGAPPRPYRDYIGWLAARDQHASRGLWAEHLAGLDGPTLLTPALTAVEPSAGLPHRTEVRLDATSTARLTEAARSRGVTVNTLVQMAWAALLSVFTDRSDVTFGVTVSGRPGELSGVETMVGLFINTVPLRIRLDPVRTVGAQCTALQRSAAALRDHSYLAHAELRAIAGVGELFDTLLVYENFPPGGLVGGDHRFEANGATFVPAALESLSHFPVTIAAHMADDQLTVLVETLEGALGPVSPESVGQRLLRTVQRLIALWDSPLREVGLLSDDESDRLQLTGAEPAPAPTGVHTAFRAAAHRTPEAVALSWDGGTLTYAQLDAAAGRLAATLTAQGVVAETPVAIRLSRGPDYVTAMLAILKAGGAIVPLDPAMAGERIAEILRQTAAPVVVDEAFLATAGTGDHAAVTVAPGQAAYLVFTSGTTGLPKGVIGTHDAVSAYADDHIRHVLRPAAARLGRPLRIAHAWSFTFDAAWQPLVALLDGHTVHLIGDDVQRDAEALVEAIDRHGIDMIDTTPSMFAQLQGFGLISRVPLAVLALGGEAIAPGTWRSIQAECARTQMAAYNCYGPTETTVEAVVAAIPDHPHPVIGRPTRHTRQYVLDSWLRPVPDGVAGELYLAGAQLTRGYLGRAAETSGRFVADPFQPGGRMYRTGDVVRRDPGGALQYLGRSDDQVKIRGFRVEPGEVATVLQTHPAVRAAHVAVRRHPSGPRLVAYAATGGVEVAVGDLRAMLRERLPRYLVPHALVVLDTLPLTAHGKIDDAALAARDDAAVTGPAVAPETPTEKALAEAVAELLGTPTVDVGAELLDLGMDSIVALSVVQAARRRGIPLRARLMLECGSLRELAAAIDDEAAAQSAAPADQSDDPIPVLPNAHWLYSHGDPRRLAQTEAIPLPPDVTADDLRTLLGAVAAGHQVLRCRLDRTAMTLVPQPEWTVTDVFSEVAVDGNDPAAVVAEQTALAVDALDPEAGQLWSAAWLRPQDGPGMLLLTAHVLALDPASWRIVLGELDTARHALAAGRRPAPTREHTTYRQWSAHLHRRAAELDTADFWAGQLDGADPDLGARRLRPDTDRAGDLAVSVHTADPALTERLLAAGPMARLLAAAASRTVTAWRRLRGQDTPTPLLALEIHGRADATVGDAVDTGETVGLLSAIYPLRVGPGGDTVEIPGHGIDFGLLRYLRSDTAARLSAHQDPQLLLNYLGRVDVGFGGVDLGTLSPTSLVPEPNLAVRHELTVSAAVLAGADAPVLATQWRALPEVLSANDIETLQSLWLQALQEVAP